ncbi:hypothetical protein SAY87_022997 [Trapa incisa]|uniref:Uncharacterized protein n=1 Tax=Trapa incisa TaxID=236973 RepID=A0AAN7K4P6_9MYRT|nr:hypothetical protein SAY87_022997 [Trapa incisa]
MCLFNKDCYCRFNVHCNLSSKPIPSQANRGQKPMNLAKEGVLFLRLFEEKQEIRGQQEDEVKSVAHAMIYVHRGPPAPPCYMEVPTYVFLDENNLLLDWLSLAVHTI